jgi:hypothetical protein
MLVAAPLLAVMNANPVEPAGPVRGPAVTRPELLTVAAAVSDDVQVTLDERSTVELSDKVPVAVSCIVVPGLMLT